MKKKIFGVVLTLTLVLTQAFGVNTLFNTNNDLQSAQSTDIVPCGSDPGYPPPL